MAWSLIRGVCMVTILSTSNITHAQQDDQYGVLQDLNADHSGFLIKDPKSVSYIDERVVQLPDYGYGSHEDAESSTQPKTKLGLLDSGINPDHPQLSRHELILASFTDEPPEDNLGHGTSVAILMSLKTSSLIFSAKVTDKKHRVRVDAFIKALAWMKEHEVSVVNVSLAFDSRVQNATAICAAVKDFPGLVVAAAGNKGKEWKPLPSNCESENVISVTNENPDSGTGDIAAPIPSAISYTDRQIVKAIEYLTANNYADAIDLLGEFVDSDDANQHALYYSAYAFFQRQELVEALRHSQTLIDRGAEKEHVLWLHSLIVANMGKRARAVATLDKLTTRYPENKLAERMHIWVLDEANDLPASLKEFFENNAE